MGKREGAGRKPLKDKLGEPVAELTIRITKSQADHLKRQASKKGVSVAEIVRRLIDRDRGVG